MRNELTRVVGGRSDDRAADNIDAAARHANQRGKPSDACEDGEQMRSRRNTVTACLCGVGAALLLVGVVSGTLIRHVVQIVPVVAALAVVRARPAWGPHAALPVFAWWLLMMVLVWLYLAGVPMFFDGDFTPAEIVLTGLTALFCVLGLLACVDMVSTTSVASRIVTVAVFGSFQFAMMWVSFLRPFVNR